ncbi:MAG TPA: GMC family oxidoreductase N-terminal domain-containing protein [Acidisarcina sp.]
MEKLRLLVVLALPCLLLGQSAPPAESVVDPLLVVHQALYSSFLPVDETKRDAQLSSLLSAAEAGIWSSANQDPRFRQLLTPFLDLRALGAACGISSYLAETRSLSAGGPESFAALSPIQREHILHLLGSCDQNEPRRLAMTARNFYVVETYGAIGEPLSGVRLNLGASHEWIEQHRPKLLPSRLRFDPVRKEISSHDGDKDSVIDYLVVGSGPAGSVLAHELRRGGKRVVLVERGSLIVPGSMETRLTEDLIDSRTSADGSIYIHNGMAVGGGSLVNVDLCFAPTLPEIQTKIESWRRDGRIGLTEFNRREIAAAYGWVKTAIGTRTLSNTEINANNHVLWDGALRAGLHPKLYDLNTYPPGKSPYPVTDKRSSESQLILSALQDVQNPLSILPDADVRRVLFELRDGQQIATGVEVRMRRPIKEDGVIADPNALGLTASETLTIHARNVILSAGALGSPAILLRSGVANDQIGRGVILHPSMPILGKFDRTVDALTGTQASVYVDDHLIDTGYALESMSAAPPYAALMSPGPPMHSLDMVRSFRNLAGFGVMLVDTPSPDNRLVIDDQGEP